MPASPRAWQTATTTELFMSPPYSGWGWQMAAAGKGLETGWCRMPSRVRPSLVKVIGLLAISCKCWPPADGTAGRRLMGR